MLLLLLLRSCVVLRTEKVSHVWDSLFKQVLKESPSSSQAALKNSDNNDSSLTSNAKNNTNPNPSSAGAA